MVLEPACDKSRFQRKTKKKASSDGARKNGVLSRGSEKKRLFLAREKKRVGKKKRVSLTPCAREKTGFSRAGREKTGG